MKRILFTLLYTIIVLSGCTKVRMSDNLSTPPDATSISAIQSNEPISTPAVSPSAAPSATQPIIVHKAEKNTPEMKTETNEQKKEPVLQITSEPVSTEQPVPQKTVKFSVKTDDGTAIISTQTAPLKDGDSALDLLVRICKEKNIPVVYSGTKKNGYVEGINSLFEFDKGAESGWIYRVNGIKPSVSSGSYQLKENDIIEWEYVLTSK